ncbi:MAG: CPBP family glutamic-type intramembrane protease [Rhodothermales bacterium]|nr:CPBP family glutamic-type intramembrane protease [Rhodothermales bacterium]
MTYLKATKTATYGFLSALPLFLLYEVSILFVNHGSPTGVRVGADVWMKQLLVAVGAPGMVAVGVAVLAIGIAVFVRDRRKDIPIRTSYFGGILLESLVYAVVVALMVSAAVSVLLPMAAQSQIGEMGLFTQLSLSLGAGLYEELVFRVILVGGMFWILTRLGSRPRAAYIVAAVVGAALFSAVHYIGVFGDPFSVASFLFRFLFGLALNAIFLLRGFGVAAWTHALYDVLVVSGLMG